MTLCPSPPAELFLHEEKLHEEKLHKEKLHKENRRTDAFCHTVQRFLGEYVFIK